MKQLHGKSDVGELKMHGFGGKIPPDNIAACLPLLPCRYAFTITFHLDALNNPAQFDNRAGFIWCVYPTFDCLGKL